MTAEVAMYQVEVLVTNEEVIQLEEELREEIEVEGDELDLHQVSRIPEAEEALQLARKDYVIQEVAEA